METTMQNKPAMNTSIIALVIFAVALLGAVFYVKPAWDEVSSLGAGRDEKLTQKSDLNQKLTDLQNLQESINTGSEISRETSLAAVPEKLEEDKLILDLAKISHDNDITLNGVNFGISQATPAGEVSRVSVNANLTGTEDTLIGFLRGVEANGRKILVKSITVQIGSSTETTTQPLVNFNVNMETYYQGQI